VPNPFSTFSAVCESELAEIESTALRFQATEAMDEFHAGNPEGHAMTWKSDCSYGIPVKRQECLCGWHGPWFRSHGGVL